MLETFMDQITISIFSHPVRQKDDGWQLLKSFNGYVTLSNLD